MQTLAEAHNRKRRGRTIGLTPLIDVVFILLIFFMLASSFQKTRTIDMTPPTKDRAAAAASHNRSVTVTVLGGGRYDVGGTVVAVERLDEALADTGNRWILIRTTRAAVVQDVVLLLDLTKRITPLGIKLVPFAQGGKQ